MGTRYINQYSPAYLEFAEWAWDQLITVPPAAQIDMLRFLYGQGQ